MRSMAVGWDLDGTLARSAHRKHLLPPEEKANDEDSWADWREAACKDEPIEGAVALMRLMTAMNPLVQHIAISYRGIACLEDTRQWAEEHGIPLSRYMLCPLWIHRNRRPDSSRVWKIMCIRQLRTEGIDVQVFLEDWLEDAQAITEATGVPVLRCTEVVFGQ
jgi:hypothetical protein